jgi:hypothetical protein
MQLLRIQRNGHIDINEDAINLIASCNSEIGFVSVVGKMRTGKSCLLNRLLGLTGRGVLLELCSLQLILQCRAAHKGYGCGLNQSLTLPSIPSFSFSIQKDSTAYKKMQRTTPNYLPSLYSFPHTSSTTQWDASMNVPSVSYRWLQPYPSKLKQMND